MAYPQDDQLLPAAIRTLWSMCGVCLAREISLCPASEYFAPIMTPSTSAVSTKDGSVAYGMLMKRMVGKNSIVFQTGFTGSLFSPVFTAAEADDVIILDRRPLNRGCL